MLYLVPDLTPLAQVSGDAAPVPTFMTAATLIGFVLTVLIPIVNGLLTRWESAGARAIFQLVLNTVNGFFTEWLDSLNGLGSGDAFNVTEALFRSAVSLVAAIAVQAGVWAPLGVSAKAKSAGVGAGETKYRNAA
jgi:hypothetical protein